MKRTVKVTNFWQHFLNRRQGALVLISYNGLMHLIDDGMFGQDEFPE
jgi:hypothetical protein